MLAAACDSSGFRPPAPLPAAPEPAVSPSVATAPAGRLVAVGQQPEGVVAAADGTLAVSVRGPGSGIVILTGPATEQPGRTLVGLPGEARHLELAGPDGPVLVPDETEDRLYEVALDGTVAGSFRTGRQPHDAAEVDGTVAVGDEFGNSVHLIRYGSPPVVVPAPLQPGGVAASGDDFVVVGVRARVIAAYRADGTLLARAACGIGPTHVVAGPGGLFFVADTLGGRVLAFGLSGRQLRQVASVSVGDRPYGLAADPAGGWLYVTLTGSNQVVGLHFAGSRVTARRVWPTGRQPNSIAVDTHDQLLAVTATAQNELELIPLDSTAG
jgi:DNA-binding beta-propeller fold protein YncE